MVRIGDHDISMIFWSMQQHKYVLLFFLIRTLMTLLCQKWLKMVSGMTLSMTLKKVNVIL